MASAEHKRLDSSDEVRTFNLGKVDLVNFEAGQVGRLTLQPGWKWSNDGKPLRANMSISMSQQKIEAFKTTNRQAGPAQQIAQLVGRGGFAGGQPPGTAPLVQAAAGATLQGLADASGSNDWQSIAAANGIENPRLLAPGQLVNLNPVNVSANLSI